MELTSDRLPDWGIISILRFCGEQGFDCGFDIARDMIAKAETDPEFWMTQNLWSLYDAVADGRI